MAVPTTRDEMISWAKRKLGDGVVNINVSNNQVQDRADEALQMFQEYHSDASELLYTQHTVSNTDITNEYISTSDQTLQVVRIWPISQDSQVSSASLFSIPYHFAFDITFSPKSNQIQNYYMNRQNLNMILDILGNKVLTRFTRHRDRLYLDTDWDELSSGDKLILEEYRIVDPANNSQVYGDMWLLRYLTALLKEQWGTNLKKYNGIALLGGITMNGQEIYSEAIQEKEKLIEELRNNYEFPAIFCVG